MALLNLQKESIKNYLISKIREKLQGYDPETTSMPFHFRLLGKDRMALFSFIHSVNTMLGQSVFEKVARIMAERRFKTAIDQYKQFEGYISRDAVLTIDSIMRSLRDASRKPGKAKETKEVLDVAQSGNLGKKIKRRIDLFLVDNTGKEYYFELKTAKPNIREFVGIKKELMEWVAMRGSTNRDVVLTTILAIPYNPYEPKPYERWTLQGLFDLNQEILVGQEFWDFIGGAGAYDDLLDVFESAGIQLREEIDQKMAEI